MSGFGAGRRPASRHAPRFDDDDDEPFESEVPSAAATRASRSTGAGARASGSVGAVGASVADDGSVDVSSVRAPISAAASARPKRSLRGRALAYLSRREHSRSELARKLAPFVEPSDGEDAIALLLDRLIAEGWLADNRFAESVVNRRAARFGTSRIVGELKRHRIDADLVQQIGAELRQSEAQRIRAVWQKKFGVLADTPQQRAKQARFLATRGFSRDLIMKVLNATDDDLPSAD